MKVLVSNVLAVAIQHTKSVSQIPERPAPPGFFSELQAITHPSHNNLVGRVLKRAGIQGGGVLP